MSEVSLKVISSKEDISKIQEMLKKEPDGNNLNPFGVHDSLVDGGGHVGLSINAGENLVGHAICYGSQADDGSMLEISKLYIFNEHRRFGYGASAVTQILALAEADGIDTVFVEPLDDNAHKFWESTELEFNKAINRFEYEIPS